MRDLSTVAVLSNIESSKQGKTNTVSSLVIILS